MTFAATLQSVHALLTIIIAKPRKGSIPQNSPFQGIRVPAVECEQGGSMDDILTLLSSAGLLRKAVSNLDRRLSARSGISN
jgi:hypothetical protein